MQSFELSVDRVGRSHVYGRKMWLKSEVAASNPSFCFALFFLSNIKQTVDRILYLAII